MIKVKSILGLSVSAISDTGEYYFDVEHEKFTKLDE